MKQWYISIICSNFLSKLQIIYFYVKFLNQSHFYVFSTVISLLLKNRTQSSMASDKTSLCWCLWKWSLRKRCSQSRIVLEKPAEWSSEFTEMNCRVKMSSGPSRLISQRRIVLMTILLTRTTLSAWMIFFVGLRIWSAPASTSEKVTKRFPRMAKRVYRARKSTF